VFPIDRLGELAQAGRIGSVASRHISFAGNQPDVTLSTLSLDSGPAAASLLREDGVHVVLITGI
jgi:D-proline reductase (dithiol) PrdB